MLVKLHSQSSKFEVYKKVKHLKESEDTKKVYIKDDLPADIARQRQDLRCLASYARDVGYEASVRGNAVIVDNVRYTYSEINNLPEDVSLEKAKTISVDDGLAFQSERSFLSSMYPCQILHDGHALKSAEQVYWYEITKLVGDQLLNDLVRDAENGYKAKQICSRLRLTDAQKPQREIIMKMVQRKKYDQNPNLKHKLINTDGNLYEATRDEYFGSGLGLAQKSLFGKAGMTGSNKLGHILMDLRGEFRDDSG